MKNRIHRRALLVLALICFTISHTHAQVQVGLNGNYFFSAAKDTQLDDGLWGGGAAVRYFVSPRFAVGLNARYFRSKASFSAGTVAVESSVQWVIPGLQAEYFLTESAIRPYVGVEGNYHLMRSESTIGGQMGTRTERTNNLGLAPKAGVQFLLSKNIGFDVNAGYHLIFTEFSTEKNWLLGAGLVFQFGER